MLQNMFSLNSFSGFVVQYTVCLRWFKHSLVFFKTLSILSWFAETFPWSRQWR